MRNKNKGLTVVELLTVLAVIAILVGVLLPTVTKIVTVAKETRQKAEFATLTIGISSYKNDMGDYPPSDCLVPGDLPADNGDSDYCGSQKLAEAMVGYDLFGFHSDSEYKSDGKWTGGEYEADPDNANYNGNVRKGPYIDMKSTTVVPLEDTTINTNAVTGYFKVADDIDDGYLICDTFKRYNENLKFKVGAPVLYFRAYTNRVKYRTANDGEEIYDYEDNWALIDNIKKLDGAHPIDPTVFYSDDYMVDKKLTSPVAGDVLPYNKDSFILISAGKDGLYGTVDDIFNFDKD